MRPSADEAIVRVLTALLAAQRRSWEQGVAAQAVLDLGNEELAFLLADAAVRDQARDGRLGAAPGDTGAVDGAACLEAVLRAAARTGDQRWSVAAARQLEWLVDRAQRTGDGTLYRTLESRQVRVDTVYMVVVPLAIAGRPELAVRQFEGHRRRLYDERTGLYAVTWDEGARRLLRPEPWGTGNGWVVAGIARALHLTGQLAGSGSAGLREQQTWLWPVGVREQLAEHARQVIDACLAYRGADGVFPDVLTDPTSFREANLAQMLAYAAFTGVADGWLALGYAEVGRDLLAAADRRVDSLGLVTGVCGAPRFDTPGTSPAAQAFHLLAHAALDRLDRAGDADPLLPDPLRADPLGTGAFGPQRPGSHRPASDRGETTGQFGLGEDATGGYRTGEYRTGGYRTGGYDIGEYQTGEHRSGGFGTGAFGVHPESDREGWRG